MAVTFSITRNTTRFHDSNGNGVKDAGELDFDFGEVGVYDPGDILYTRITITNTGDQTATGVTIQDTFTGSTMVDAGNVVSGTPFVNISPIAFNDTFQAIGNTVLRVGTAGTLNGGESTTFAGNLLSNDVGSLAGDSIQGFKIDVVGDGTFAGSGVTAKGGHYNILADGSFNYVNSGTDASLTDGDTFNYTIRDKGFDGTYGTADDLISVGKVTITFAEQSPGVAHRVWYVDSNAAPGGDGTSANPFQTLATINGVTGDGTTGDDLDQAGEYIYVENGAGAAVTGPITLENGQRLIGDGADLIVAGTTLATAGANSTITAATGSIVTLASGNTIAGLNIGAGTGTAAGITGTNFGTLTVNNATINAGGQALNLNTGTFAGTGFTSTDSDGGSTNVSLVNVTGDVALGTGALSGATTNAINVSNTTGAAISNGLTYSGSITHAGTGALLNVDGGTAGHLGTIGLTGTKTATAGLGLNFENADGDYSITGTTSLSGGNAGIDIVSNTAGNGTQGSAGNFTFGGTFTINNPGGSAVVVSDSTANVNFDVDVTQSSNFAALDVTNHSVGTFTFQTTASFNATNGTGLQFTNADGIYNMNSANTLNGGDAGIDIDGGSGGSFTFIANTAITNPTGDSLVIDNSTATVSFGGSITDNSGRVVNINQHDTSNNITFTTTSSITATAGSSGILIQESDSGGTIAFNGQVQLATTTNNAVTLTNNSGTTINFNADDLGLDITTTSGRGFQASGGGTGTVTVQGSGNTIASTTGIALDVQNTNIGLAGLTFVSISSNGANNGIVLNNTGITAGVHGGLTVTGDATAAVNTSGGIIQNSVGVGIALTSTRAVSFDQMQISGGGNDGINAQSTFGGFSLTKSLVQNNGNGAGEHGIELSNVTGTLIVDNTIVRGSFEHNFTLNNQVGTLDVLNIKNSTFDHLAIPGGAAGGNGVLVVTGGTAVITDASISNSTFRNNFSNGILVNAEGGSRIGADNATSSSTDGFVVANNTFDDNNIAIQFGQFNTADLTVDIQNNTIINDNRTATSGSGSTSMAIIVGSSAIAGAGSSLNARIDSNTIGSAAIAGSGSSIGSGIRVIVQGLTDATVVINNNTIRQAPNGYGIEATFLGPQDDLGVVPTSDITVTNNNVDHTNYTFKPGSSDVPLPAIYIAGDNQAGAAAAPTVRADVRGNTVPTALPPVGFVSGFTNNWLEVYEYDGSSPGIISLLDTGAPDANATAQLTNNNTGRSGANVPNVALFTGTITTAPDLSPLPINAAAPPPAPPPVVEEPTPDTPPVVTGPAPTPSPVPAPVPAGPVVVDDGVLSQAELDFIVDAAIQRWAAAGASAAQVAAMRSVKVSVSDMGGLLLGESGAGTIVVDSDAAGWRWFVDSTPSDDSEYSGSGTKLAAVDPAGIAGTRIDLLTVLTHELGHQIGLADLSAPGSSDELMFGTIAAGERRLPGSDDLDHAAAGPVNGAFAFAPITLGTIPAGQTVTVEFRHVIDAPAEDGVVGAWKGQTILDSDQTAPQNSNVESGNVDGLALGDLVFKDVNKDGNYDVGTDTLMAGVTLSLFADTNNNGVYDASDLYVGYTEVNGTPGYQQGADTPAAPGTGTALTATTAANGTYSFGSLAPGDYIVRIDASNFAPGGALQNLLITPGAVADPDDNTDNDNNGVAAAGGAVVSQAIRLDYNMEPTAGPGNDTNNTLDFGFVQNDPPVANDDPGLTATEDQASQYSTQLTANDTDPDVGDTLTITSAGNVTNGSVSVTAGVVTFTPTANFNGTATFEYTINDGHGHTDVGLATVTVGAVNDPVTIGAPATAALNEDAVNFAVTGISISDVDSALAPAGVYEVVLQSTHGTLKLTTVTGLTFTVGDGDGDSTMTFHGTLADLNAALATVKYTPAGNYNGSAQIDIDVTDQFGATVATGSGAATADFKSIALTVNPVNDAPAGTDDSANVIEGATYTFSTGDFSDGFSDPLDGNAFNGVAITQLPATGTIKLNGVAIGVNAIITKTQLDNGKLTYDPAPGSAGTAPTFKFAVQDDGGFANGGVDFDQSPNTFTLNVAPADIAPVLDLDANGAGTGFASAYTEGGAAAAISDTDVSITDADVGDQVEGATITITNAVAGDVLTVVGALPGSITVDPSSTATNLVLTGTGTQAQYEAAIEQITFSNTGDNPTALGTNLSRTINVTVTDGSLASNVAVSTVSVADDNADAPSGTSATITAVEDTFRLIGATDLGFSDVDGTFASVTISAVSGGKIYVDADGSAGAGAPVEATLPVTFTAQDLVDGKASFLANANLNGSGVGTITFTVRDDDGNADASPNVLTVDVTAVNDSPVLTTPGPIAATEQTAVAILPAGSVADVDLDARNGGNGDYAGASFSVNRNSGTNAQDVFTLVAAGFTIDGANLKSGGSIFGTISVDGSAGALVINFTSLETPATSALVDAVIQSVRYTNTSDNPPASVEFSVGFNDGAPGGAQGSGAPALDTNLLTVNIAGVNDAPVNSLGGTIGTGEDAVNAWLSGMSISDPDANPATDKLYITFQVTDGTILLREDVPGGVTSADVIAQSVDTYTVFVTLNQINATLAATNGLTYTPTPNFNGNATLTVSTNDNGHNGSDPGLSGDGTSEEGVATRTIAVSASPDAPIAQPDAVSTPENAIKTGSLFDNNGSGPDSDADGDSITVSEVNGSPADVGVPIVLASGAILTVNADGTYSYDPNGKFTKLTDNTSGAVNTSQVGDTFSYTVAGGNTVSVTVTINGVAGPGDWLAGDGTDNTITGTPQADFFFVVQGGDDHLFGLAGNDVFFFGGAMTSDDDVDGGDGVDQIALQGNYSAGLTFGADVVSIENLAILPGNDTRFGDSAGNLYDYNLTLLDVNVASGVQMIIDANRLRVGEDLTFNGSAETNGSFFIYGGSGTDNLTGGSKNDVFLFGAQGQWGSSDVLTGGGGIDQLALRGDYNITFGASQLVSIEQIAVVSAYDTRFGNLGDSYDYNLTMNDANVVGIQMTIDAALLRSNETLSFNGSAEDDGSFRVFGGAGNDVIQGSQNGDIIVGRERGDTLYGNGGNDVFRYDSVADSNSTERDGIQDFNAGDLIDLSRIDANVLVAGDQAFSFIGSAAFSNTAGELRFENISLGGPVWMVQGDIDGNGVSDFEVVLVISPADPITASDFIL